MPTITRIIGTKMKGLDFSQPLSRLNLFVGQNGSGKTARTQAIILAINGYVPGQKKGNTDILDTFGDGQKLFAGIELSDKSHLLRRWARENGSVSQDYMLDRKKTTRDKYMQALAGIKVLDLNAFMELSDQKKTSEIFNLFPPAGDLGDMESKIEEKKTKQNTLVAEMKTLAATKERLTTSRAAIALPAGTMAETTGQIAETEKQLTEARQALETARIKEAAEKARIEADEAAAKQLEAERETIKAEARVEVANEQFVASLQAEQAVNEVVSDPVPLPSFDPMALTPRPLPFVAPVREAHLQAVHFTANEAIESLRSVLDTMQRAGCGSCAAILVCKREIAKLRKGVGA